jgi:hypothetical protein
VIAVSPILPLVLAWLDAHPENTVDFWTVARYWLEHAAAHGAVWNPEDSDADLIEREGDEP